MYALAEGESDDVLGVFKTTNGGATWANVAEITSDKEEQMSYGNTNRRSPDKSGASRYAAAPNCIGRLTAAKPGTGSPMGILRTENSQKLRASRSSLPSHASGLVPAWSTT